MSNNKQTRFSLRKGLSSDLPTHAPLGEPLFCTDTGEVYVGMGEGLPPMSILQQFYDYVDTEPVKVTEYAHLKEGEDWTPVFQYLIDNGYKNILAPIGVYTLKTPLLIQGDIRIQGEYAQGFSQSYKTIFKPSTIAITFKDSHIKSQNQDVTIEDIYFLGGTTVIDLPLCHLVRIRRCIFNSFSENGIVIVRGERHEFSNLTFWSQTTHFKCAFAFADKTKTTHKSIQSMDFGVDKEWIDRMTLQDCTVMYGNNTRYDYALWGGNKVSHSTIRNFYAHGGLKGVFYTETLQQSECHNWVMDAWGTTDNPCEKLINIGSTAYDSNFMSVSPGFAGNNKCIIQFYIKSGMGLTIQSCHATGDNSTTFGFRIGNSASQVATFIGCRGSIYSESTNNLHKCQLNIIGCDFIHNNIGHSQFYGRGFNEVHNLMSDGNGASKSTNKAVWQYSRGGGNTGQMFEIQEDRIIIGHYGTHIIVGTGDPNGVYQAPIGSIYTRKDGGVGTTLYVKESGGGGNTGWTAK